LDRQISRSVLAQPRSAAAIYSSRIIKAGALLTDTKTLLSHWDLTESAQTNLQRLLRENVFGKASRSRVQDIVAIFRQRYLTETAVTRALVALVNERLTASALDRILYFHATLSDRLLHDVVTEWLYPLKASGTSDVEPDAVHKRLAAWVAEGKTTGEWTEETTRRVAQGLLATLRDFGLLEGSVRKRIAPAYLPVEAFAYILFYLKQHQPSGAKLIEHSDWKLFFLSREGVERFLFEAHQQSLLEYHAAGSVTRLTFPAKNLEEYARVLTQR
jgi:Putative inner membrane protein (DUF1819)